METTVNIHLGSMVRAELLRQEKSVSWFAQAINLERSGIYKLFRRKNISVQMLLKICIVLNHDFFDDVSEILKNNKLQNDNEEDEDLENVLQ